MNAPGVRVRRNWKWASTGTRRGPDFEATNCAFHPTLRRRASSTAYSAAWTACPARTSIIAGPRNAPSASRCSPSADTRYVHLFRLIFRTTVQCPTTVSSAYQIITRWIFLKNIFLQFFCSVFCFIFQRNKNSHNLPRTLFYSLTYLPSRPLCYVTYRRIAAPLYKLKGTGIDYRLFDDR